jgi:hypothetical protein
MNYDEKNVDRSDVLAQSGCDTLQQENQTYVKNDHHDEGMGHNQSV